MNMEGTSSIEAVKESYEENVAGYFEGIDGRAIENLVKDPTYRNLSERS